MDIKKSGRTIDMPGFIDLWEISKLLSLFFVHLDDLNAIIAATMPANSVSEFFLVALRAFYDSGGGELPVVSSTLITPCFRCFSLRYCHFLHLLFIIEQLREFF